MEKKLTKKQKLFCDYYIEDEHSNATQSAIKAGYSPKTARQIGAENLSKPYIKQYIARRMESIDKVKIASMKEVLQFITACMRGEITEDHVVVESIGDFKSKARIVQKRIGLKERLQAAEKLAKKYSIYDKDTSNEMLTQMLSDIVLAYTGAAREVVEND